MEWTVLEGSDAFDERTDEQLLRDLGEGDKTAMAELYSRYELLTFAVAYRVLRDQGAAEDCVQDAFIALWTDHDQFDPSRESARSWLLTRVRNAAVDRLRERPLRPRSDVLEIAGEQPGEAAGESTPDATAETIDARRVRDALNWLPIEQRDVIELAFFNGLTYYEISDSTRVPIGTVTNRMLVGLQRLRESFMPKKGRARSGQPR